MTTPNSPSLRRQPVRSFPAANIQSEALKLNVLIEIGVLDASANCIYFSDMIDHTIKRFDLLSQVVTTLCGDLHASGSADGPFAQATFSSIAGITLDEKNRLLYVSNKRSGLIRRISLKEEQVESLTVKGKCRLGKPGALVLDSNANHLYISDQENNSIKRILLNEGKIEQLCESPEGGHEDGALNKCKFHSPSSLAWNAKTKQLYFADYYNHCIRLLSPENKIMTTLCGLPREQGAQNGTSEQATFYHPRGLVLDAKEEHIFAIDNNKSIRKISLTNKVTVEPLCGEKLPDFYFPKAITFDCNKKILYVIEFMQITKIQL